MALTATQIYTIVNEVASQAMGTTDIKVVDNTGLVSLGARVLGTDATKNNFINALTDRIGRTIVSFRAYHSHFPDFERDSIEWGNILQKLKIGMPDAEKDDSYDLEDGTSIDQYKINKPMVNQLLFTSETPWQTHITVHLDELEKAFLNANAMGSFISGMFGEVQNRIELAMENLSMDCVNNYIGELVTRKDTTPNRVVNLLTEYKEKTAIDYTTKPEDALHALDDENFLKYVVRRINGISSTMEYMTNGYYNSTSDFVDGENSKAYSRHTPKSEQKLMLFIDMVNALKTNMNSKAFNMEQVAIDIPFTTVPFWQSLKKPSGINVKTASGTEVSKSLIMGVMFDREAMGTFKKKYTSLTTPINAAGKYYNVFYHMITMYFNDLTENGVIFLLE